MGRYLDIARAAHRDAELEAARKRMQRDGFSIAIDRATGTALLLFKKSHAEIPRHVADVYQPFEVELTAAQRKDLLDSLRYFDAISVKQAKAKL